VAVVVPTPHDVAEAVRGTLVAGRASAIRPFQISDAPSVHEAVGESLPELPRWMPELDADLTVDAILEWINGHTILAEEQSAYDFAVVDAVSSNFLGGCGLTEINHRHRFANLYYWVRSSCTGQGVATQAVRLVARYGLTQLRLNRIEIVMAVSNPASRRVAEKAGAVLEGTLRQRIVAHGVTHDAYMFSLVPLDVENSRPTPTLQEKTSALPVAGTA
jgi:ribosomal-protein-serine acetyltransferase